MMQAAALAYLVAAAFALNPGEGRPALPAKAEVERAYRSVKGAVVNTNLLMTSVQARLKRVQFAFNQAGSAPSREKAKKAFDAFTERLGVFRAACDRSDTTRAGASEGAAAAASRSSSMPEGNSTAELLEEIALLRSAYEDAASRRAAEDVGRTLKSWRRDAEPLKPGQTQTLSEGKGLVTQVRRAARALKPSPPLKGGDAQRIVLSELAALEADAAALETELELLSARYKLDNLIAAHPELGTL